MATVSFQYLNSVEAKIINYCEIIKIQSTVIQKARTHGEIRFTISIVEMCLKKKLTFIHVKANHKCVHKIKVKKLQQATS